MCGPHSFCIVELLFFPMHVGQQKPARERSGLSKYFFILVGRQGSGSDGGSLVLGAILGSHRPRSVSREDPAALESLPGLRSAPIGQHLVAIVLSVDSCVFGTSQPTEL